MRNSFIKDVRAQLTDSRIFMGKTKLMVHALGSTVETEHATGLRTLTPYMSGDIGLLFTHREPEQIEEYLANFTSLDFARAGTKAAQGFMIPTGELRTTLVLRVERTIRYRLGLSLHCGNWEFQPGL